MKVAGEYQNRMSTSSHIREVGAHVHSWQRVGVDGNNDLYQECDTCGTRRVRTSVTGRTPLRQDWINGGPWEVEEETQEKRKSRKRLSTDSSGEE
jgi:hypothetical protein